MPCYSRIIVRDKTVVQDVATLMEAAKSLGWTLIPEGTGFGIHVDGTRLASLEKTEGGYVVTRALYGASPVASLNKAYRTVQIKRLARSKGMVMGVDQKTQVITLDKF